MAERRMFSKAIIDSDSFLDMPATTQLLYFHLGMRADDDGFVDKPRSVLRMIGGTKNDLDLLFAKQFLIPFESGVVVLSHWKLHNYIRKDRYSETIHLAEKAMLSISGNGEYTVGIPSGNQRSTNGIPMVDPGKVRLGKVSIGKSVEAALPPTRPRFSPPIPPRNPPFCFAPAQRSHPAFTAAAALYIIYKYIYLTLSIILHINRKLYITYNSYYYAHSFFKAGVLDDSRSILSDRQ